MNQSESINRLNYSKIGGVPFLKIKLFKVNSKASNLQKDNEISTNLPSLRARLCFHFRGEQIRKIRVCFAFQRVGLREVCLLCLQPSFVSWIVPVWSWCLGAHCLTHSCLYQIQNKKQIQDFCYNEAIKIIALIPA